MNLAWSEALDRYAESIENKTPLKVDPVLYELLAQDRAEAPFGRPKYVAGRPRRTDIPLVDVEDGGCNRCGSLMRPYHTRITDYPNTVQRAAKGMCMTCYRNVQRHHATSTGGAS